MIKLNIQQFGGRGASSSSASGGTSGSKNVAYSKILDKSMQLATANTPTISNYEASIEAIGDKSSLQYRKEQYQKEIQYLQKRQTLADGKISGYTVNDIAEQTNNGKQYLIHDRDVYFLNYDKNKHKYISTKVYHQSSGLSLAGKGRHFFMKSTDVRDLVD